MSTDTESLCTERPRKAGFVRKGQYNLLVQLCIYKNTCFWTNEPFLCYKKPVGQTPECKDSEVVNVSCSSTIKNSNYYQFQKSSSRSKVNINKYPMENQIEQTQYFYVIQCQGNRMIVCTLSFLSTTVVNVASGASLKSICKSCDRFCLVIM